MSNSARFSEPSPISQVPIHLGKGICGSGGSPVLSLYSSRTSATEQMRPTHIRALSSVWFEYKFLFSWKFERSGMPFIFLLSIGFRSLCFFLSFSDSQKIRTLSVSSFDADASTLPSGEKAAALTDREWPSSVCSTAL